MALARPKGDGLWGDEAQEWVKHLEKKKVEQTLHDYARADYNHRMAMWLENRDLREAFDLIDQLVTAEPKKPRRGLCWLRRRVMAGPPRGAGRGRPASQ